MKKINSKTTLQRNDYFVEARGADGRPSYAMRVSYVDGALDSIEFRAKKTGASTSLRSAPKECVELEQYFSGKRRKFSFAAVGVGTSFQRAVWKETAKIPFGETRTYGEIAKAIGRPKASRAVGAALGRNPLPIIVPCHRVIGSNGALTGFAGGLKTKKALLEFEMRGVFPNVA